MSKFFPKKQNFLEWAGVTTAILYSFGVFLYYRLAKNYTSKQNTY